MTSKIKCSIFLNYPNISKIYLWFHCLFPNIIRFKGWTTILKKSTHWTIPNFDKFEWVISPDLHKFLNLSLSNLSGLVILLFTSIINYIVEIDNHSLINFHS